MKLNDDNVNISHIKSMIKEFEEERNWDKCRNPKDLCMSIAIEASELMEVLQWDTSEEAMNIKNSGKFEHFKEEIADVIIYSISLINSLDIDLFEILKDKLYKNSIKYPKIN